MALIPVIPDLLLHPAVQMAAVLGAFGVGLLQGVILGRAILVRFPRLQRRLTTVSVALFALFLTNAILSVPRFASPEKITLEGLRATSPAEFASVLFLIFGTSTGFLTVLAISVTVMGFIVLRVTGLGGAARAFVLFFSSLLLVLTVISRLTDLTPSTFEVLLYFMYQLGITAGILAGTARKIRPKKVRPKKART